MMLMMAVMHNHSTKLVLPPWFPHASDRTIRMDVPHHAALTILSVFLSMRPFPVAASVPASETESVNTENQNGEDEKTTCCGPLW